MPANFDGLMLVARCRFSPAAPVKAVLSLLSLLSFIFLSVSFFHLLSDSSPYQFGPGSILNPDNYLRVCRYPLGLFCKSHGCGQTVTEMVIK